MLDDVPGAIPLTYLPRGFEGEGVSRKNMHALLIAADQFSSLIVPIAIHRAGGGDRSCRIRGRCAGGGGGGRRGQGPRWRPQQPMVGAPGGVRGGHLTQGASRLPLRRATWVGGGSRGQGLGNP